MTFTYTPTNDIGKVRRLIGDTVEGEAELTDEEIQAWLDENGGIHGTAAVKILRSLSAKYARRASFQTGNEKIDFKGISQALAQAADELEADLGTSTTVRNVSVGRVHDTDRNNNYRWPYNQLRR